MVFTELFLPIIKIIRIIVQTREQQRKRLAIRIHAYGLYIRFICITEHHTPKNEKDTLFYCGISTLYLLMKNLFMKKEVRMWP